jgi:hypothetical protein
MSAIERESNRHEETHPEYASKCEEEFGRDGEHDRIAEIEPERQPSEDKALVRVPPHELTVPHS